MRRIPTAKTQRATNDEHTIPTGSKAQPSRPTVPADEPMYRYMYIPMYYKSARNVYYSCLTSGYIAPATVRSMHCFTFQSGSGSSGSICPPVNGLIFSVPAVANATSYVWTFPNGTDYQIVNGAGTNSIEVNVSSSAPAGFITVAASNICGASSSTSSLEITIGTGAEATAGADQFVCVGTTEITLDGYVGGAINPKKSNQWSWTDNGAGGSFSYSGNYQNLQI